MAEYAYEALDKGGKVLRGSVEAAGEDVVIERLRNMGYYPLDVSMQRRATGSPDVTALPVLKQVFHRVTCRHLANFTRQLATLLDAGLPIHRSMLILQRQARSLLFKDIIGDVAGEIERGHTLSEAIARHPRVFDSLYVNMVRAGEAGGVLETILNSLALHLERRQAIIGKVRSAMIYPGVVVTLAVGIVSFIMLVVMPKFRDIYASLNAELPWLTQALIDLSTYMVTHIAWLAGAMVLCALLVKRLYRTREFRYMVDSARLRIPWVGEIFRKLAVGRFASTFSTLLNAGVPILQTIDIVRETSGNEVITRAMNSVYNSVRDGDPIHLQLAREPVFPPMLVEMVAIGEETGALDQMLTKVAEAYERDVENAVAALTSVIEPLLIVFLGITIGVVVVALYLPIFIMGSIVAK